MKKILVFLFLSINFLIFGQNSKLFVSFIEKAELNFKKKNYPKAILLGKQALVEAQEYKSPKNKIISFHLLGKISYEQKDYTTSKQYFKQGLQLFAKKDTSVDKTNLLIDLSKSYNSAGEFDSAIFYLTSILNLTGFKNLSGLSKFLRMSQS